MHRYLCMSVYNIFWWKFFFLGIFFKSPNHFLFKFFKFIVLDNFLRLIKFYAKIEKNFQEYNEDFFSLKSFRFRTKIFL